MITHHGICMDGGHYTCDIFNSHQWLECNDEIKKQTLIRYNFIFKCHYNIKNYNYFSYYFVNLI